MIRYLIVLIFILLASLTIIHLSSFSLDDVHAQHTTINPLCIIRGESIPPPPFIVLRWDTSNECNATIDHFTHFYDIRAIINNNTDFIIFLESN